MQSTTSPRNPNPNKPMLAFHFIRALARIKSSRARSCSSSPRANFQYCGWRIKRAAYASMALAAGPRRVWSRAILRRLRRRAGARAPAGRRSKKARVVRPKAMEEDGNQADKLRRLVPGGRRMDDFCSLLEETGHYVKCLTAQVQLMQRIADSISKQAFEFPNVENDNAETSW